ncbi:unnamed protein product [Rangifer tarandus platyrhynchus]|uniref:Uncharacterized protein n=2 Tax=Rangifer tarandus platyrhynchus TaxID=3082113 RepID=A0ABN8ZWL0_RANTA|nr:unnamed protein product [Rangifer tarandus platyrhynchus]
MYLIFTKPYEVRTFLTPYTDETRFRGGAVAKNPPASAGDPRDTGSASGSGRPPGKEMVTHFSALPGKSRERRSLVDTVRGVARCQTRLSTRTAADDREKRNPETTWPSRRRPAGRRTG